MQEPEQLLSPCIPVETLPWTRSKLYRDGKGSILKWPPPDVLERGPEDQVYLIERRILEILGDSLYFPQLYVNGGYYLIMEDFGKCEPITDLNFTLGHAFRLMADLAQRGVTPPSDLEPHNIIIRDNIPHLIDFSNSKVTTKGLLPDEDRCRILAMCLRIMEEADRAYNNRNQALLAAAIMYTRGIDVKEYQSQQQEGSG